MSPFEPACDGRGQPVIPVQLSVRENGRDEFWGRLGFLVVPSVGEAVTVWHDLDLVQLVVTGVRHSPAMLSAGHDPGEVPVSAHVYMTAVRA